MMYVLVVVNQPISAGPPMSCIIIFTVAIVFGVLDHIVESCPCCTESYLDGPRCSSFTCVRLGPAVHRVSFAARLCLVHPTPAIASHTSWSSLLSAHHSVIVRHHDEHRYWGTFRMPARSVDSSMIAITLLVARAVSARLWCRLGWRAQP